MLFQQYCKEKRWTFLAFFCFTLIFAAVFFLYQVKTEAVLYAVLLCVPVGAAMLAVRFLRYAQKHKRLSEMMDFFSETGAWPASVSELSPAGFLLENRFWEHEEHPADSLLEAEYIHILQSILKQYRQMAGKFQQERQDMMDYYTTWVHQIKTPIAALKLRLQDGDTEEHRRLLAELFRIEQYVEMVLVYFRLDSPENDLVLDRYPLDGIIRQAIRKYAHEFVQKRLWLTYEPVKLLVLTDEKWLLFIIEQILSNSLKYTKSGGITIRFTQQEILEIRDTGIGIAPEDLPRIFEKGYTGYNGRADKKSSGLGLYLCKRAAGKLGHRIWAESDVNVGTVIYLDLKKCPVHVSD